MVNKHNCSYCRHTKNKIELLNINGEWDIAGEKTLERLKENYKDLRNYSSYDGYTSDVWYSPKSNFIFREVEE